MSLEQATSSTNPVNSGEEEVVHPLAETRAHWSLFLPSIAVASVYSIAWALLAMSGRGEGALAKIMFLVLIIATPLLLVQAFLRYKSAGLALTKHHVLVARGWPRLAGEQLDLKDIEKIDFRSGLLGRWLGVGKVVVQLKNGRTVSVSDLSQPKKICDTIRHRISPTVSSK